MKLSRMIVALLLFFTLAAEAAVSRLYVVDATNRSIHVYDTDTDNEVTQIQNAYPEGGSPRFLVTSPDGLRVAIIYSVYTDPLFNNYAAFYNTLSNTLVKTVEFIADASAILTDAAYTADSQHLLIVREDTNQVISLTAKDTLETVTTVAVGTTPNSIAIAPDGSYAYVTNQVSNNLSRISQSSIGEGATTINLPGYQNPQSIVITSDSRYALIGGETNPGGAFVMIRLQISDDALASSPALDQPTTDLAVNSATGSVGSTQFDQVVGSHVFTGQANTLDNTIDFALVENIAELENPITNLGFAYSLSVTPDDRLLLNLSNGNQVGDRSTLNMTLLQQTGTGTAQGFGQGTVEGYACIQEGGKIYVTLDSETESLKVVSYTVEEDAFGDLNLQTTTSTVDDIPGAGGIFGLITIATISDQDNGGGGDGGDGNSAEVIETIFLENLYIPNKFMKGVRRK